MTIISNDNRDTINKMNRASQNVNMGTIIQDLQTSSSGLGTMSTQSASAVAITGGTITGVPFSKKNIAVVNSPYTLLEVDYNLRCNALSASIVINLLPATGSGKIYNIENLYTSQYDVDVVANTSGTPDLIIGETNITLTPKSSMTIQDGAINEWDIL